ncbi:type IV pilin protein [Motilimonas cestriensis]|uniref:Type IV pilin protein n=1 Tax=Motilimonas cestriensis TaxID=2742685 RepID=A0ABS8WBX4_9GAMM|nr:type IV pilin protein [Motilimonas cestriensis]
MRNQQGFTLIEIMITVAIVGILAAIAYPSYMQYVLTSSRAQATTELTEIANLQEQYYLDHNRYAASLDQLGYTSSAITTENGRFNIKVSSTDREIDFTVTAKAIGQQLKDTTCLTFTLNYQQKKEATSNDCWKK